MADTGATVPGVGATIDRGYQDWSVPARIEADDGSYTYSNIPNNGSSDWLRGTQFGFSIDSGATINGIKLELKRYASGANKIKDSEVRLLDASGTPQGDSKPNANYWATGAEVITYGGASDLWGYSWTPAIVNDPDFGARLYASNEDFTSAYSAHVDYYKITVYYTLGAETKKASFFQML